MTGSRVVVGRDVRILAERDDGIEIEGSVRLRPGHPIDVVTIDKGDRVSRRALVWTWTMTTMGSGGPTFRGFCEWT